MNGKNVLAWGYPLAIVSCRRIIILSWLFFSLCESIHQNNKWRGLITKGFFALHTIAYSNKYVQYVSSCPVSCVDWPTMGRKWFANDLNCSKLIAMAGCACLRLNYSRMVIRPHALPKTNRKPFCVHHRRKAPPSPNWTNEKQKCLASLLGLLLVCTNRYADEWTQQQKNNSWKMKPDVSFLLDHCNRSSWTNNWCRRRRLAFNRKGHSFVDWPSSTHTHYTNGI